MSGVCDAKEDCLKTHSTKERLLHSSYYKSTICSSLQRNGLCDKVQRICYDAHTGQPDLFYHEDWKNLYVEGLKNTFDFLSGAVRMLFKFPELKCPRVLLITPSSEVAKFCISCIKDLAVTCHQKVIELDQITKGDESASVIIATVESLVSMMPMQDMVLDGKVDLYRLKALILDDGPTVLRNIPHEKKKFFQDFGKKKGINVVITAEKTTHSDCRDAKKLLSLHTDFQVCSPSLEPEDKPKITKAAEDESSGTSFPSKQDPSSSSLRASLPDRSSPQSSQSSLRQFLRDDKVSSSTAFTTKNRSRSPPVSSSKMTSTETKKENRSKSVPSSEAESENRNSSVLKAQAKFMTAIEDLKHKHDQELTDYVEMPEVHPSYEEKYNHFRNLYWEQFTGKSDMTHFKKLWKEFWKEAMIGFLDDKYENKIYEIRRNLQNVLEGKVSDRVQESSKRKSSLGKSRDFKEVYHLAHEDSGYLNLEKLTQLNPTVTHRRKERVESSLQISQEETEVFFCSIPNTLDLLQEACPLLGIVSSNVQSLISNIRRCGEDKVRLWELFQKEDNRRVLQVVSERCKVLSERKDSGHQPRLHLISVEALKLLDYVTGETDGFPIESPTKKFKISSPERLEGCSRESFRALASADERQSLKEKSQCHVLQNLDLLSDMCPVMGLLSPVLEDLVKKLRDCWEDDFELCKVLQKTYNNTILKRFSEKLQELNNKASSSSTAQKYQLVSLQILKLLDYPRLVFLKQTECRHRSPEREYSYSSPPNINENRKGSNIESSSEGKAPDRSPGESRFLTDDLAVLEEVASTCGLIGPVAKLFIQNISHNSYNKAKLCEIIQEENGGMILGLISEKAKVLSQSAVDASTSHQFQRASSLALQLLEYPKFVRENSTDHSHSKKAPRREYV